MKDSFLYVLRKYDPSDAYIFMDEMNYGEPEDYKININEARTFYAILTELKELREKIESLEYRLGDIEDELNL